MVLQMTQQRSSERAVLFYPPDASTQPARPYQQEVGVGREHVALQRK